jgi:hypothetical protein
MLQIVEENPELTEKGKKKTNWTLTCSQYGLKKLKIIPA